MGAHGGWKRIVRYECTTCGEDRYEKKQDAIECCDRVVEAEREAKAKRTADRLMAKVKVVVRAVGRVGAEATAQCPGRYSEDGDRCIRRAKVRVNSSNYYVRPGATRKGSAKQAMALCLAQMQRHLQTAH